MKKQSKWLKYGLIIGIVLVVLMLGATYDYFLGYRALPIVYASNANGEKIEMFRHGVDSGWNYGLKRTSYYGEFATEVPDEGYTLAVKPGEEIMFTSGTRSKIRSCEGTWSSVERNYIIDQPEYEEYVGWDEKENLTLTAPSDSGKYLIKMRFKFNRGDRSFGFNLIVQDD